MQYCCLQDQTLLLSPVLSTTGCCFCFGCIPSFFLELFLHWSPVPYWALSNLGNSVSYLFHFSCCSWGSQGKNTEVVCHSLLQWATFCQTSPPWPVHLGWPHMAWLSFIELDRSVVHVIRLASCLWLWFPSVCPLMPSLSAYLIGFLLPWTWGISSWLLQQITAAAPDLECGVAPLGLSFASSQLPHFCAIRHSRHASARRIFLGFYSIDYRWRDSAWVWPQCISPRLFHLTVIHE